MDIIKVDKNLEIGCLEANYSSSTTSFSFASSFSDLGSSTIITLLDEERGGEKGGEISFWFRSKNPYKDPDDGRQRFLLELEFIQCLSNPTYIHYLAQNRYFEDDAFIGYLKYLQYWQRPEYIKFIMYPHCLFFLELLQNANFRNAMAHPGSKELAHRQQYYYWKNYRNNRLKHILPRSLPEPPAAPMSAPTPNAAPAPASAPILTPMPPMTSAAPVHSPMQFVGQPGSAVSKSDIRNTMGDRRKRKKDD
ncbi:hypothetical protein Cni_G07644 [Canna indica]|uniref:Mediator of RNA polymerase II transcription subunit 31 n=1 Tax=Canna indica TaxID=4628 RepID=A0AAQ3Q7J2_9LILI|nr:hypothetical protein Cni_G07644 [Canna indica]